MAVKSDTRRGEMLFNKSILNSNKKVEFTLTAPTANTVMLAGSFNKWDFNSSPLKKGKDNVWRKELALTPGKYEYKFVVDGKWMNDPSNKNRIGNSFGTENSILEIK